MLVFGQFVIGHFDFGQLPKSNRWCLLCVFFLSLHCLFAFFIFFLFLFISHFILLFFCFCVRPERPELNPKPRIFHPIAAGPSAGQPSAGQPFVGQPSAGPPKIWLFFPLFPPQFSFFFLSNVHIWALGLSCESPAAPRDRAAGVRTHNPRTPNVHISRPRRFTPPKFHERTARERKKKENCGGKREEKSEILGLSLQASTLRGPTLRGLHPPFGASTLRGLHPSGLPLFWSTNSKSRIWPKWKLAEFEKKSWPKSKLAEVDRALNTIPLDSEIHEQMTVTNGHEKVCTITSTLPTSMRPLWTIT